MTPGLDTSAIAEAEYHARIMKLSPEERFLMGASMCQTARAIVTSSILAKQPDLTPAQLKKEIFLRYYKNDFETSELKKILAHLTRVS